MPRLPGASALSSTWATALLLGCSLAVNAALGWKVHALRAYIEELRGDEGLKIGAHVSPISARDTRGAEAKVEYDQKLPLVLYVFRPGCAWCRKNRDNFNALSSQFSGKYRILALSLTNGKDLGEFISENHMTTPVLTDLQPMTVTQYRLGGTPETIVVSPQGMVLKTWVGAYDDATKREVESYFGIHLPGLAATAPPS